MKYFVFSVRDRAADAFGQPFYHVSVGGAIRSFADEVNTVRENNPLNKHPEDFDLYELGLFDDSTAEFECGKAPRQIAVGKDLFRGKGD